MTYAYGDDNAKKRGRRWLLDFCAICGDSHKQFMYGSSNTELTKSCPCTAGLQSSRRAARRIVAEFSERERAHAERRQEHDRLHALAGRPPTSIETKLGA